MNCQLNQLFYGKFKTSAYVTDTTPQGVTTAIT